MVTSAGQLQPHGKGIVMEVSGSSKEKECLAFMINKMSKRISLPKQRLQSNARLPAKGTRPDGTSLLSLLPHCFGDKNDPDLCQQLGKASLAALCESDKNNAMKDPAAGYALDGSVFPGLEGHCQAELDLQPTHIKAALS